MLRSVFYQGHKIFTQFLNGEIHIVGFVVDFIKINVRPAVLYQVSFFDESSAWKPQPHSEIFPNQAVVMWSLNGLPIILGSGNNQGLVVIGVDSEMHSIGRKEITAINLSFQRNICLILFATSSLAPVEP